MNARRTEPVCPCVVSACGGMVMIDPRLLKILVCPKCHGDLEHKDDRLICTQCGLRYPIRDGIPVMLVEEAEPSKSAEEPSSGSSS